MTINIQNLDKLIKHLKLIDAANFNMSRWFSYKTMESRDKWHNAPPKKLVSKMEKGKGDCGTAGCIAGHAALLRFSEADRTNIWDISECAGNIARVWLNLTLYQSEQLFRPTVHGYIPRNIPLDHTIKVLEYLKSTAEEGHPEIKWGNIKQFLSQEQKELLNRRFGISY